MKIEDNQITLSDGEVLPVTPHAQHGWTQTTEQVACGYQVKAVTIRKHLKEHSDELIEGEHFYRATNSSAHKSTAQSIHWTKLGVATLGFFIRSKRAKEYRRKAAELVIEVHENKMAIVTTDNPHLDALQMLINSMRQQEENQKLLENKVNSIALREEQRSGNLEWLTCAGFLTTKGVSADRNTCAILGRKASKVMKSMNLERGTMLDPRFGQVYVYHPDALEEAFNA